MNRKSQIMFEINPNCKNTRSARLQLDKNQYIEFLYRYYLNIFLDAGEISGLANNNKNLKQELINSPRASNIKSMSSIIIPQILSKSSVNSNLKIMYYGDIGTSGYAMSCCDYYLSLYLSGANMNFQPCIGEFTELTLKQKIVYSGIQNNLKGFIPDIIFIHTLPTYYWKLIIENSRKLYPNSKIVGLTVWEASKIPTEWHQYLEMTDMIIVPSEWNRSIFDQEYLSIPIRTVHNPIGYFEEPDRNAILSGSDILTTDVILKDEYVFYTIGDWIPRKNISTLIEAFIITFDPKDKVVLFIKTSPRYNLSLFKIRLDGYRSKGHKIIVNHDKWSESKIMQLHSRGDCYVSTCKSEGTGLGACSAAYHLTPVLITSGSGQTEYLKGCFYINSISEIPLMCDSLDPRHSKCSSGQCHFFPHFSTQQIWSSPVFNDICKNLELIFKLKPEPSVYTKAYIDEYLSYDFIAKRFSQVLIF